MGKGTAPDATQMDQCMRHRPDVPIGLSPLFSRRLDMCQWASAELPHMPVCFKTSITGMTRPRDKCGKQSWCHAADVRTELGRNSWIARLAVQHKVDLISKEKVGYSLGVEAPIEMILVKSLRYKTKTHSLYQCKTKRNQSLIIPHFYPSSILPFPPNFHTVPLNLLAKLSGSIFPSWFTFLLKWKVESL